jgi:hypothetical protein
MESKQQHGSLDLPPPDERQVFRVVRALLKADPPRLQLVKLERRAVSQPSQEQSS